MSNEFEYRDKDWLYNEMITLGKTEQEVADDHGLVYKYRVDPRYIRFNSESTRKLDLMITKNIPNDLDIVQYKILKKGR